MTHRVALIIGYGANIGRSVASAFAAKGFRIATVSRSDKVKVADDYLSLRADLANPSSIEGIFDEVIRRLGHPGVVVYNASANSVKTSDSIGQQLLSLQSDNNVNIVSPYVAAQLAVRSFAQLPPNSARTFIYTGNILNLEIRRPLLSLGTGKSGGAHLVRNMAESHKEQGYKFFYADERNADGSPAYGAIDGPAHAEFYAHLAEEKSQVPWLATFVKGQGYVKFNQEIV